MSPAFLAARSQKQSGINRKLQIKEPIHKEWVLKNNSHKVTTMQSALKITPLTPSKGLTIMNQAISEEAWGIASAIDIYNCNPATIRDAAAIRRFVVELCDLIEMKRFGETQVVHFGEDEKVAGYSMVQLIETSLISGHFANLTNAVYLDVFSCKPYLPERVQTFAQAYFEGTHSNLNISLRL
jgi:S-adenosylmethionine/arginine decarboxylase-like enzyme